MCPPSPILFNNFLADNYVWVTRRYPACAAGTNSCTPLLRSLEGKGSETWTTIMIILALHSSTPCQLTQAGLLSPHSYVKHYAVNDVAISSGADKAALFSCIFSTVTSCYKLSWTAVMESRKLNGSAPWLRTFNSNLSCDPQLLFNSINLQQLRQQLQKLLCKARKRLRWLHLELCCNKLSAKKAVFLVQSPAVTSCHKQLSWRVGN